MAGRILFHDVFHIVWLECFAKFFPCQKIHELKIGCVRLCLFGWQQRRKNERVKNAKKSCFTRPFSDAVCVREFPIGEDRIRLRGSTTDS